MILIFGIFELSMVHVILTDKKRFMYFKSYTKRFIANIIVIILDVFIIMFFEERVYFHSDS